MQACHLATNSRKGGLREEWAMKHMQGRSPASWTAPKSCALSLLAVEGKHLLCLYDCHVTCNWKSAATLPFI